MPDFPPEDPYKTLVESSFSLTINCNDFFNYNDCYAVQLNVDDLDWVIPIIEKYGTDGLNAVIVYIKQKHPLEHYRNQKFKEALMEIENLNPEIESDRTY